MSLSCYCITEVLFILIVVDCPTRFAVFKVVMYFTVTTSHPLLALPTVVRWRHHGRLAKMFLVTKMDAIIGSFDAVPFLPSFDTTACDAADEDGVCR